MEFKATILYNSMKSQKVKFLISITDQIIKASKEET